MLSSVRLHRVVLPAMPKCHVMWRFRHRDDGRERISECMFVSRIHIEYLYVVHIVVAGGRDCGDWMGGMWVGSALTEAIILIVLSHIALHIAFR